MVVAGGNFEMRTGTHLRDNNNTTEGGGVRISGGGSFTMHGGTISDITGNLGGGVRLAGGTFTMYDGIIRDNSSNNGAGVFVLSGTVNMHNGTIGSGNAASGYGGGIDFSGAGGSFNMTGGVIMGNTAGLGGGNVYFFGMTPNITGGEIHGGTGGNVTPNAVTISTQPASQTFTQGSIVGNLYVTAWSTAGTRSFQWYQNGSPISGANGASLTIPTNLMAAGSPHSFHVVVSSGATSVTSETAVVTVNPATITITGVTATTRTFDGTTTVMLTGGTLQGASGDVGFTLGNGTIASPNAGTGVAVTTNIQLTGADVGNFTLTQPTNVTVNITQRPITITPNTGQSKIYGTTTDPTLTFTTSGTLVNVNGYSTNIIGALSRTAGENVGTYPINIGTLSAGANYTLSLAAGTHNFTIEQATVTSAPTLPAVTRTAYQARNATTTAEIAALAELPATVTVNLNNGNTATLSVAWASTDTITPQSGIYTFIGTLTGTANTNAPSGVTATATVEITATTASNPGFATAYVAQQTGATGETAADLGTTVLPTSGNIMVNSVSVPYTITWSGTLDRTAVNNFTIFNGTRNFTAPAWLTLPIDTTVTRRVEVTALELRTLSFPDTEESRVFNTGAFTITATPSVAGGAITYTSSDTSVATVNPATGEVTIVGVGQTTITATIAETATHISTTASYELTITRANQTAPAIDGSANLTYTVADAPFTLTATGGAGNGALEWSSSDTAVATINSATGQVTIIGTGTTNITVLRQGGDNHNPSPVSAAVMLTVNPAPAHGISLAPSGNHTFPAAQVGYGAQVPHAVAVNNTGNQPTGNLTVALTGANASNFTLSATSINSIGTSGNANFTVVPNAGLAVGTHTATVTVSGANAITASFNVSFEVTATPTHTISYNANSGTGTTPSVSVIEGNNHTVSASGFTRTGYNFTGWNTQADGNGTAYVVGATISNVTANINLYAQWTAAICTHPATSTTTTPADCTSEG